MAKKPKTGSGRLKSTDKPKMGRPSKWDTLDFEQVRRLALKGWTDAEMAEFFEVDYRTWMRWKANHDDFCQTLKLWKEEADSRVERSLYERATGYVHEAVKIFMPAGASAPVYAPYVERYPPDTTAMIFWLKNRQPKAWRDRQPDDDPSDDTIVIKGGLPNGD